MVAGSSCGSRVHQTADGTESVPGWLLAKKRRPGEWYQGGKGEAFNRRSATSHPPQPVSHSPGFSQGGKLGGRSQGADRPGLRRALFLGHGNLPAPIPHIHFAADGKKPFAPPLLHARPG